MTFWQNLRRLCIAAPPRIVRSEERRSARLFSILMLLHAGLDIGGVAVILVAYALLRWGLYRLSLWVYILTTVVVPLVAPFVPDPNASRARLEDGVHRPPGRRSPENVVIGPDENITRSSVL